MANEFIPIDEIEESLRESMFVSEETMTIEEELDKVIDAVGFKQVLQVFQNIAKQNGVILEEKVVKPTSINNCVQLLESAVEHYGDKMAGVAIAVATREGPTFYQYYNEWSPVTLIGEVKCLEAAMTMENLKKKRRLI